MSLTSTISRQALRTASSAARASRPALCYFSTSPSASSASASSSPASTSKLAAKKEVQSSCAAGTVLHGLSILKDQPDPVAKADEEYPEWLWTIIPSSKKSELATQSKQIPKKGHEFDYAQEKKRLRAINKSKIKASNFLKAQ